jgi:putative ABC transport system permease protein
MTVRERIGEFAVFKTLGFGALRIAGLIFGESLVITLLGTLFGILFTYPAAKAFGHSLSMYFPIFKVAPETIYLDIVAGFIVGLLAAIIPTWRAIGIKIAEALRRIA